MMSARLVVGLTLLSAAVSLAPSRADGTVRRPDRIGVIAGDLELSRTPGDPRPGRSAIGLEDTSFALARERDDDFHWGRVRPLRDLGWAALGWIAIANDARVMHAIRSRLPENVRHSAPVDALSLISEGYVTIPAALAVTMLGEGKLHDTGKLALASILVTAATVDSLKTLTGRGRPDGLGGVGAFRGPFTGGNSFPSGQTAAMFSLATVVAKRHPKAKWWAYGLATGTAISRVFLDRHHPSDVLFGALVGIETGNFVLRNDGWLTRISIKF